jgi:hypothetical protein
LLAGFNGQACSAQAWLPPSSTSTVAPVASANSCTAYLANKLLPQVST